MIRLLLVSLGIVLLNLTLVNAQSNAPGLNGVQTYVNPVLPGDHPDQTMIRIGKDFYTTGSSFHFTPYLPILHSTDMMHWETIARVIPATSSIPSNDAPQNGTWQGALASFNNKYWVYFSNTFGGQYFCNATNMAGPWSAPVKVNTNTGVYGYDNSIFVDDDGTPYMLLKNGQDLNGLQKLGMDGQPVGQAINMDWVNSNGHPYSWAEGPVMCKRNGRYYLFVAGNVGGGQYVLSSANLTAGESSWTRHGTFWSAGPNQGGFTGPNHVTQPIKLDDGTWWCLAHAYDNAGYEGQGRQSSLHQVIWDANGVPKGVPVNLAPVLGPNLPTSNIPYEFGKADYFGSTALSNNWHFFNKAMASSTRYSLSEKPGYLRLKPSTGTTHVLQKDKGKYYSLTTKVDFNANANGQESGLRIMNGWDDAYFNLYSGYNGGKKIGMNFAGVRTEVANNIGNTVWLRIERELHILTCYYSSDGKSWTQLGTKDISTLDASQREFNGWVGTSVGLYATNLSADFDLYSYRYGFVPIKAVGRNNWFGTNTSNKTPGTVITNGVSGDWMMLAGVDMGTGSTTTNGVELNVAAAASGSSLEVWLDNIEGAGTKLATVTIAGTGGADVWKNVTTSFAAVSGQHDIYLRWVGGSNSIFLNTIRFTSITGQAPTVNITAPTSNSTFTTLQTVTISANAADADGTVSKVDFYDGTTLLGIDNSTPYSYSWSGMGAGAHIITAVATDNAGLNTTSEPITINFTGVEGPYGGTAHPIPGIIQAEEFDLGGNGLAYYDATAGSDVTPPVNFRTNEDVDIEPSTDLGGGYNVGYATKGEWLKYSVNVLATGSYSLSLRVAEMGDGKTMHIEMDDVNISGAITIPNTAGWQTWTTLDFKNVILNQGKHIMKVSFDSDYINLNYVEFKNDITTGLEEEQLTNSVIFPNPFTEKGIQGRFTGKSDYQIHNILGNKIEAGSFEKGDFIGQSLPKGIYILNIQNGQDVKTFKITRQ